jgi:excisionase family DNA binding protein
MIDYDNQEKLLTTKEAAELLKVSITALRLCVRQGRIRGLKLHRQVYFRYEDLGAFMMNAYPSAAFVRIAA